ncbi:MAG: signal peptidase I [Alphaproteobacteria bacterium]|nr:signal peptidase I [Alphaproteobacteria bacterium]
MKRKKTGGTYETIKTVIYAVLIAVAVRTFVFEPFNIPSGSMIPTLLIGDYLFVSKYSYGYSRYSLPFGLPLIPGRILVDEPKRGDVAVFKLPSDNRTDYIKRVIGLPGDRVQMIDGILYINGTEVPRQRMPDYVERDEYGNTMRFDQYLETLPGGVSHPIIVLSKDRPYNNTREFLVPAGRYFMMGDNRDNSADSRAQVGYVPLENFVGRARVLFFSVEGSAHLWEAWKWPWAIRFVRIFQIVH